MQVYGIDLSMEKFDVNFIGEKGKKKNKQVKSNICVIGIGSNIEPHENIRRAIELVSEEAQILSLSSFVITKPIGTIKQPDFLNGAVKVCTNLSKTKFKEFLRSVEDDMGRDRSIGPYGPRNIDLDIVVWNGKIIDSDYYQRDFLKKTVDELI